MWIELLRLQFRRDEKEWEQLLDVLEVCDLERDESEKGMATLNTAGGSQPLTRLRARSPWRVNAVPLERNGKLLRARKTSKGRARNRKQ